MAQPRNSTRAFSGLQLDELADLVSDHQAQERARALAPPREGWRLHFAGWMGVMYGPVPVGHLLLGLLGLYVKLS